MKQCCASTIDTTPRSSFEMTNNRLTIPNNARVELLNDLAIDEEQENAFDEIESIEPELEPMMR